MDQGHTAVREQHSQDSNQEERIDLSMKPTPQVPYFKGGNFHPRPQWHPRTAPT